jgi:GTP-binding protein HflX
LRLPGGTECVFADTVGFIRELPHELVAAFRSTLTEAREATLLLHVIDASNPRRDEHIGAVNAVLEEIGAGSIRQICVYNKIDRLGIAPRVEHDADGLPVRVWLSAARGDGLELLRAAITERIARGVRNATLRLSVGQGALRSRLYASGTVRAERALDDGGCELTAQLPDVELLALARLPGVQVVVDAPAGNVPAALGGLLESPVLPAAELH